MAEITFKEAINQAFDEELARDERVFLIGEDIALHGGVFGVTQGLFKKYGFERVKQTPISESAIIGAATGASMLGLRPVAEIMYFDFITCAMDQVINQAAKIRYMSAGQVELPLVIRTQAGAGRGKGAQHSQDLEAFFFHIPGIKVVIPSNAYDAKGLMKTAIRDNSPVLYIDNAFLYNTKGDVPEGEYTLPFGKAARLREGRDLTVVAYGAIVNSCSEALAELENEEGITSDLLDLRTVVPLDMDAIIDSLKKTNRLLVVHEAYKKGGIGAEIAARVMEQAFDYLDAPVMRIGEKHAPIPLAETLENVIVPGKDTIKDACRDLLQ